MNLFDLRMLDEKLKKMWAELAYLSIYNQNNFSADYASD